MSSSRQSTGRRRLRNSRESTFLQASPQVRVHDVGPAYHASPDEHWCDLELVGVVLDGLSA